MNCKKDKPEGCWDGSTHIIEQHSFDTINPSNYIMAYPGSWWEYDNGSIDTCKGWFAQKTERNERDGSCLNVNEDLIYIPRTSIGKIFNGSLIFTNSDYQETKYVELIDVNKSNTGVSWGTGSYPFADGDRHSGSKIIKSEIIEHLDSFQVNGIMYYDIIHCQISDKITHFKYNTPPPTFNDYYFAKNIGLIKKSRSRAPFTSYYSDTTRIINHYIAPH
ncbi:hypothetical protein N9544_03655 [Flavobacteriales bacterium]|nr:hypothetical protein [Flavobacteriales bacterium]